MVSSLHDPKSSKPLVDSATNSNKIISDKQSLYVTDALTPGSVFFLPHGTRIFNKLLGFMRSQQRKFGFEEVVTPLIYKQQLWEKSGHWENYKDDMFQVDGTDVSHEHYGLKPMNCPGHCIMFDKLDRSHNELPIRFSDFSPLHRNEASGALSGLTRVRRFHQDDGHIFCRPDQVGAEISSSLALVDLVYRVFNLPSYRLVLSTRPENYIGSLEDWNRAEADLKQCLDNNYGENWQLNEGDGAFYGPKIDILLKDHTGKEHQTATIQLDFQLPVRFDLKFRGPSLANESSSSAIFIPEDQMSRPVLIHRAVFGSLERFLSILIDHYNGKWPFWLSPRHALVVPVAERHINYAQQVVDRLSGKTDIDLPVNLASDYFHIEMDSRAESIGLRLKNARQKGYNYVIVIGDAEVESGLLPVKKQGEKVAKNMSVKQAFEMFVDLEKKFL
ncbi:mitochondrial threonyl-tRNA synthetase [Nadsonia fulvescens var. elongata DSM 6958]|uniref:threonine--tRNA ligase n=1 Tax=Nadsonia fulvescens var. elongata DSM 6958 TaxID=857566 RepID=A0A1E3PNP8_9ASCO|nr:mitochondrial threonyl-tRNA synthetase [Nadsonia fulvescens var. elongata DSM 6958]